MLALRAAARDGLRSTNLPGLLPVSFRRYNNGLARSKLLNISEEIQDAVATGKPVVALESTIYTHGIYTPSTSLLAHIHGSVTSRISIPRKLSPRIAAGIGRSSKWRSTCHYRNS